MRHLRASVLLGSLTVLAATAVVAYCCGPYGPPQPIQVKLPGQVNSGVVRGNHFYAVTVNGRLIAVDLRARTLRDYGTFDMTLSPIVDVADGKALVTAQNRIYQVDLQSGKIVRAQVCEMDSAINKLSIIDAERVCVQDAAGMAIVNLSTGKKHITLGQRKSDESRRAKFCALDTSSNRLFTLGGENKAELTILDLEQGKVIERIPTPNLRWDNMGGGEIRVVGDKAYIACMRYGYGVWTNSFGVLDLKTHKYQALKLPSATTVQTRLITSPGGSLFLVGPNFAFEYDADGKLLGNVLPRTNANVVGLWRGQALTIANGTLESLPLQDPAIASK